MSSFQLDNWPYSGWVSQNCPTCGDTLGGGYHQCRGAVRADYGLMYLALGNRIADLLERLVTALEKPDA